MNEVGLGRERTRRGGKRALKPVGRVERRDEKKKKAAARKGRLRAG